MKRIIHKLQSSIGASLAEMLLTILILLLASTVVVAGMPAAVSAYRNAIDAANAQVLLSAAVNALRSELSTARDVKVDEDGKGVTYIDADTGSKSRIYLGEETGSGEDTDEAASTKIMQRKYMADEELGFAPEEEPLQSPYPLLDAAMRKTTKDGTPMTALYTKIEASADGQYVTITGLSVQRGEAELAKMPEGGLKIRVLTRGD